MKPGPLLLDSFLFPFLSPFLSFPFLFPIYFILPVSFPPSLSSFQAIICVRREQKKEI